MDKQDRLRKWEMSEAIDRRLPVIIHGQKINGFTTRCNSCGKPIKKGLLRGVIEISTDSLAIEADGACFECKTLTAFSMQVLYNKADNCLTLESYINGELHKASL